MKNDVYIKQGVTIPEHELEFATSRAGGPGGQHVNKTETRVTVRWNVHKTVALNPEQKQRVLEKLQSQLTGEGDLVISNAASRSQQDNKEMAIERLAQIVRQALYIPKKRMKTKVSKHVKQKRVDSKRRHGEVKKLRSSKFDD